MQNRASTIKKKFIWDCDNPIESKKKINNEFYFSTNSILNKSEIKKTIRKIKEPKKKYIRFDR